MTTPTTTDLVHARNALSAAMIKADFDPSDIAVVSYTEQDSYSDNVGWLVKSEDVALRQRAAAWLKTWLTRQGRSGASTSLWMGRTTSRSSIDVYELNVSYAGQKGTTNLGTFVMYHRCSIGD